MKIENAVNTVVEPYLWVIETKTIIPPAIMITIALNRTYEWLKHSREENPRWGRFRAGWTVPMSDWNSNSIPVCIWNSEKLNRTYEWYVAFAELIVLYEYYELFR